MNPPLISICIANYNGAEVLLPCIESVLSQTCAAPVEIIVHDDASTDNSCELLARSHPDIRVIRSTTNVGFCISNNRMARAASGAYLLLLNNDATLRSGTLQGMLATATSGFDGVLSAPQYRADTGQLLDRGCRMDWMLMPVPILKHGTYRAVTVMGACLWIPKLLWEQIGGFPPWIGSVGEDTFLCLSAWHAGPGVRVIEGGGYNHVVGLSFGGGKIINGKLRTTTRRRFLSERNRLCVMSTFCPSGLLPLMIVLYIAEGLIEGMIMSVVKRNLRFLHEVTMSSIMSAWGLRRMVRAERKRMRELFGGFPVLRWIGILTLVPQKLRAVWHNGIPDVR
jgi:GT2 family glycosyltransferase